MALPPQLFFAEVGESVPVSPFRVISLANAGNFTVVADYPLEQGIIP